MLTIHNEPIRPRYVVGAVLAALVYLGLYQIVGWTLNTETAAATTAAANAVLAFGVSVGLPPKDSILAALSAGLGMLGASVVLLFVIGPGNLFPIVIAFLVVILGVSTGVGWSLAQPRTFMRWVAANW